MIIFYFEEISVLYRINLILNFVTLSHNYQCSWFLAVVYQLFSRALYGLIQLQHKKTLCILISSCVNQYLSGELIKTKVACHLCMCPFKSHTVPTRWKLYYHPFSSSPLFRKTKLHLCSITATYQLLHIRITKIDTGISFSFYIKQWGKISVNCKISKSLFICNFCPVRVRVKPQRKTNKHTTTLTGPESRGHLSSGRADSAASHLPTQPHSQVTTGALITPKVCFPFTCSAGSLIFCKQGRGVDTSLFERSPPSPFNTGMHVYQYQRRFESQCNYIPLGLRTPRPDKWWEASGIKVQGTEALAQTSSGRKYLT